jgi:hypothetical protein
MNATTGAPDFAASCRTLSIVYAPATPIEPADALPS